MVRLAMGSWLTDAKRNGLLPHRWRLHKVQMGAIEPCLEQGVQLRNTSISSTDGGVQQVLPWELRGPHHTRNLLPARSCFVS